MAGARLWVVNGVLVVLALVGVLAVVLGLTTQASSSAATLRTVPVGRGTVTETVTASGTVTSATSSTLNFSTSGKIATVRVQLGDKVTAGETVATLDGQYARANLTAARAQLTAARKQLSNAIDARDNPTTTSATGSTTGSAGAGTGTGAAGTGTGAAAGGTGTGTGASGTGTSGTGTSGSGTSGSGTSGSGKSGGTGSGGSWFSSPSSGLVEQTPTPTPSPGTSGTTSGSGTAGGSGTSSSTSTQDSAQAAVDSARASVAQAQASVIQAQQGTDNLDLVSPQDGTVVSLDAVAGQVVGGQGIVTSSTGNGNPSGGALPNGSSASSGASAGGSASSSGAAGASGASGAASSGSSVTAAPGAAAVMTVADLGSLQVKANIPELDVGRVATGLPTTISVNALPGRTENGSVASVDVLPGSGTSVQYGTAIGFTAPPPGLRPGMSASVSIAVASASDTPFLPSVAVSPVGGAGSTTATVQVLGPDGQAQQRTVGIGLASDATTQVTSGLGAGDLVVLPDPTGTDSFRRGGPPQGSQQSSGSSSSSGR